MVPEQVPCFSPAHYYHSNSSGGFFFGGGCTDRTNTDTDLGYSVLQVGCLSEIGDRLLCLNAVLAGTVTLQLGYWAGHTLIKK